MHQLHLSVAGALMIGLVASAASADDKSDTGRASALFEEGRRLMASEDYAAACPKLAESQALDPAADTAFDLGICYQKASQAAFKAAHELAGAPEQIRGAASVPARAPVPDADGASPGQTQRVVGLTVGGVGVAGIVAGVITGLVAKSKYDKASSDCSANGCSPNEVAQSRSAQQMANVSTVSFLLGVASAGAGAIVFFTAPKSKTGAVVGVAPAAEGTGLSIAGSF